jgi:hypothetical protein
MTKSICVDSQLDPFRTKKESTGADVVTLLPPVADAIFTPSPRRGANHLDAKGSSESGLRFFYGAAI